MHLALRSVVLVDQAKPCCLLSKFIARIHLGLRHTTSVGCVADDCAIGPQYMAHFTLFAVGSCGTRGPRGPKYPRTRGPFGPEYLWTRGPFGPEDLRTSEPFGPGDLRTSEPIGPEDLCISSPIRSRLARFTGSTSARPFLKYLPSPLLKWVVRSRGFVVGSTRFVVGKCQTIKGFGNGRKQSVERVGEYPYQYPYPYPHLYPYP